MSILSLDLKRFFGNSIKTILKPKEFFSDLVTDSNFVESLIRGVTYGFLGGLLQMLWFYLKISPVYLTKGNFYGFTLLLGNIVGSLVGVIFGGVVILILVAIGGGNTNYRAYTQVASYILVFIPITAFASFFYGINYIAGTIISTFTVLYALYILFVAITSTLKGKKLPTKIATFILGSILVVSLVINIIGHIATKKMLKYGEKALINWAKELNANADKSMADDAETFEVQKNVPKTKNYKKNKKPLKFPADACRRFENMFSTTNDVLSKELIEKVSFVTEATKDYEESKPAELDKILKEVGFKSTNDYIASKKTITYAIKTIRSLIYIQTIIDTSEDQQRATEILLLDNTSTETVNKMLKIGKFSEQDIRILYDNWDLLLKIEEHATK